MLNVSVILGASARYRDLGNDRMTSYKDPRIVEFVDEFPMAATGRILKRNLG